MPTFRVPVVMVHMAGLRNGQWGRRGVMRALGVWHADADAVAPSSWLSVRSERLLVVDGAFISQFGSMSEFDRFAARLLLLATLLGRRAVIPSMPCRSRWAQSAMEPRHLRGLEVGCSKHKQCVWLPMPHFKEAWCNGVDFLYSIDYEGMIDAGEVLPSRDLLTMAAKELRLREASADNDALIGMRSGASLPHARVLRLTGGVRGDPLDWLPLDDFKDDKWRKGLASRVGGQMRTSFNATQLGIMQDCMHSLSTSRD
jgi:hypothetical protein